jgi:hypothetical protein
MLRRVALLALLASSLFALRPLGAQTIECVVPAEPRSTNQRCTLRISPGTASKDLVVRVQGVPPAHPVDFRLESAGGSVTHQVLTDAVGLAQFTWQGAPGGTGSRIIVESRIGDRLARREIDVVTSVSTNRELGLVSPQTRFWYERRQLRAPIDVRVTDFDGECEENLVVFRPVSGSGSASPDTVRAGESDEDGGGCMARAWWRLGEGVGRQHMRIALADEPSRFTVVTAIGRALPRIGAGVVATKDYRSHFVVGDSSRVVRVTRRIALYSPAGVALGDSTVAVDSVVRIRTIREVREDWFTTPVVSVDFPLIANLDRLRVSLGVSLKDPARDWYLGFSPLQAIWGVTHENLGVDLHVVMHAGRRRVLSNPGCRSDMDLSDCRDEDKLFLPMGFGVSAFVDGTSLLSTLGSIFE